MEGTLSVIREKDIDYGEYPCETGAVSVNARKDRCYREIFLLMDTAVAVTDEHNKILQVNSAWNILFGEAGDLAVGRNVFSYFCPNASGTEMIRGTDCGRALEDRLLTSSGRVFCGEVKISPITDGREKIVFVRDITHKRCIEKELRETSRELREEKHWVEKMSGTYESVYGIMEMLNMSDEENLFESVDGSLRKTIDYANVHISLRKNKYIREYRSYHREDYRSRKYDYFLANPNSLLSRVLFSGHTYYCPDTKNDDRFLPGGDAKINSILIVPVVSRDCIWGAVSLEGYEKNKFTSMDIEMIELLASYLAIYLEEKNSRKVMERDYRQLFSFQRKIKEIGNRGELDKLAEVFQNSFLPSVFPAVYVYEALPDGRRQLVSEAFSSKFFNRDYSPETAGDSFLRSSLGENSVFRGRDREGVYHYVLPIDFTGAFTGMVHFARKTTFNKREQGLIELMSSFSEFFLRMRSMLREKEQEAFTDALTGVWNKRYMYKFKKTIDEKLGKSILHAAIIVVDIRDFKKVNDRHGHMEGDSVLKQCAGKMKDSLRPGGEIVRYGGDEFLIYLENAKIGEAEETARRIEENIFSADFRGEKIITDIGVAVFPADGNNIEEVFRVADSRALEKKEKAERGH